MSAGAPLTKHATLKCLHTPYSKTVSDGQLPIVAILLSRVTKKVPRPKAPLRLLIVGGHDHGHGHVSGDIRLSRLYLELPYMQNHGVWWPMVHLHVTVVES